MWQQYSEKIESEGKKKYDNFYSKPEIIINESDIDVFPSIYTTIITNMQKSLRKSSGWIINSVTYHTINITLPKEVDHPRKGLIKGTLMQIRKFLSMFSSILKQYSEFFVFLNLRILKLFTHELVFFVKRGLFFNIFFYFCMFFNKYFMYLGCLYLKTKTVL